jgi:hypothetical protein
MTELLLAEELFLLTHDDDSGKGSATIGLDQGFSGALLLDLAEEGLITADGDRVLPAELATAEPHPLLVAAHTELATSEKPQDAKYWVNKLPGKLSPLSKRVGQSLAERGVLDERRRKILGLVPSTTWPQLDPAPEQELLSRLRSALSAELEPDLRTSMLIALLSPLGLVAGLVEKPERKAAVARGKEIADRDLGAGATSTAVKQAVQAVQTALMIAIMVPVITTTIT